MSVDVAIRDALAKRTVAHLSFPNGIQVAETAADPYRHVSPGAPPVSSPVLSYPPVPAAQDELDRAAQVLGEGRKRPGILPSGNLATMACGLPYAMAMQLAHPGRQVIAYVGDGGFAMLMAEFLTAVRHREPEADFAAWARSCGGYGVKVTEPGQVSDAVRAALAHPGPALVDCRVNPNEPPMPGKVRYEQAKDFTEAFLRGQPYRIATLATVARDKISQLRS